MSPADKGGNSRQTLFREGFARFRLTDEQDEVKFGVDPRQLLTHDAGDALEGDVIGGRDEDGRQDENNDLGDVSVHVERI